MKIQTTRAISTNFPINPINPSTIIHSANRLINFPEKSFDIFIKQSDKVKNVSTIQSIPYIIKGNDISFGYKSILKTEWLKGNMPFVKFGIYGGELTKNNVTLEHILPHSKGGKTELPNLALAVNMNNWERSNKPFKEYFDPEVINEYLEQFKEIDLPNFNGLKYIDGVTKIIKRILRNEEYDFSNISFLK